MHIIHDILKFSIYISSNVFLDSLENTLFLFFKINIINVSLRITGPTEATELPACSSNAHQMPGIHTSQS